MEVLKRVIDDYPARKDNVRIIEHKENRGLASSRNTCLDYSRGEFVIFVDSDDWLELNAVELLVRKQSDTGADIVSGGRLFNFENTQYIQKEEKYPNKEQMTLQMMQRTWDHFLSGRLLRRSLFIDNKLRWKDGFDMAEDRYMMTLLAYHSVVSDKIDDIIYHYEKRNDNSFTNTDNSQKILKNNKQELENVLLLEDFFKDKAQIYQKECSRCVMRQLDYNYQMSLKYSDKDEFKNIIAVIDGRTDKEKEMIRWDNGLRGMVLHSYGLMSWYRKIKRRP